MAAETNSTSHGISILEEIFPESVPSKAATGQAPLLQQLGRLPTPSRSLLSSAPLTAPPVSTAPLMAPPQQPPLLPPPPQQPPLMPMIACQAPQQSWDAPCGAPAPLREPTFASYRDKLRAGGRGAFQRAIGAGLMPKNMKQEWSTQQDTHMQVNAAIQQQTNGQPSTPMSWSMSQTSATGGQPQWNMGAPTQGDEFWAAQQQQQQQQMLTTPYPTSHMQMMSPDIGQSGVLACQPPYPQQMNQQAPQQPQMGMPQMQVQQMQVSQAQMQFTQSGDTTPTELDRCMAIVMPDTAQHRDRDMMVAQLRAAADCQCYED